MRGPTPEMNPAGWDHAAPGYERAVTRFTGLYAEEALRQAGVRPGHRVLDVAAGTGAASLLAARLGADVLATDFSPAMVERLRDRVRAEGVAGVEAAVMDGQALDLPDDAFDAAVSVFGLIFFPDRGAGFRELRRVLRPGGRAAVVSWSRRERVPIVSLWGRALRRAIPELPPSESVPPVFSLQDPEVFRAEMEAAGFGDVRIEPVTKTWEVGSAEEFWASYRDASPVLSGQMEAYPDRWKDLHRAFVTLVREDYGDEGVLLECEALIGVGTKH